MNEQLLLKEKVELWDAINSYAESCGGNTGMTLNAAMLNRRMDSVVRVEDVISKILEQRMK